MIAMWVVWLLAIYGLSTILVYLTTRWNPYYEQADHELRVQLLLYNSETCLEGAIRSLVHLSRSQGRPLHMMVYDYGSTDGTKEMLEALQKENPFLFDRVEVVSKGNFSFVSVDQEDVNPLMTIDLRQGLRRGTFQAT